MKKRRITGLVLLLGLLTNLSLFSQNIYLSDHQKYYRYQGNLSNFKFNSENRSIVNTTDGGYFMVQICDPGTFITTDIITLTKLNSDLTINWTYDLNTIPVGQPKISADKVIQTSEGGYLIAGTLKYDSYSVGAVDQSYILKIDSTGQQIWMKMYPKTDLSYIRGLAEHSDGYILVGSQNPSFGAYRAIIVCTDDYGNEVWSREFYDPSVTYGFPGGIQFNNVIRTTRNNFVAVGTSTPDVQSSKVAIVKFTNSADLSSFDFKLYGQPSNVATNHSYYLEGASIDYSRQGNELAVVGKIARKTAGVCTTADYNDLLAFTVDFDDANVIWAQRVDVGSEATWGTGIKWRGEEFGIIGQIKSTTFSPTLNENAVFLRFGRLGNHIGGKFYGTKDDDYLNDIIVNTAFNYVFTGNHVVAAANPTGFVSKTWNIEAFDNTIQDCQSIELVPNLISETLERNIGVVTTYAIMASDGQLKKDRFKMVVDTPCEEVKVNCEVTADFSNAPAPGFNFAQSFSSTSTSNAYTTLSNYYWTFGDGGTASGVSSTTYHNYLYSGNYQVCLTTLGSSSIASEECSSTTCKIIQVGNTGGGLGHGNYKKEISNIPHFDFKVSPNPVNNQTVISLYVGENDILESVQILDVSGHVIQTIVGLEQFKGNAMIPLDSRNLQSGIYFCRVIKNGYSSMSKFIK